MALLAFVARRRFFVTRRALGAGATFVARATVMTPRLAGTSAILIRPAQWIGPAIPASTLASAWAFGTAFATTATTDRTAADILQLMAESLDFALVHSLLHLGFFQDFEDALHFIERLAKALVDLLHFLNGLGHRGHRRLGTRRGMLALWFALGLTLRITLR